MTRRSANPAARPRPQPARTLALQALHSIDAHSAAATRCPDTVYATLARALNAIYGPIPAGATWTLAATESER